MASGGNPDSLKDEDIAASVSSSCEVPAEFRYCSTLIHAVLGLCGGYFHGIL
jgi:hypothetical protein